MTFENSFTRRNFLRFVTVGGVAIPLLSGIPFLEEAQGAVYDERELIFKFPKDMKNLTEIQKAHIPKMIVPPVVEDGAQAPIVVEMDHPMEPDHYIKSIQILSFKDPIVVKGKFHFTPANGEVYLGTQIRLNGGDNQIWAIAECSKHGKFAISKSVKVAAGGC